MHEKSPPHEHVVKKRESRSEHVANLEMMGGTTPKYVQQLIEANKKFFGTKTGQLNEVVVRNILIEEFNGCKAVGDSDEVIAEALEKLLKSFLPRA